MRSLAILIGLFVVATAKKTYHGHRLISVTPQDKEQFHVVTEMMRTGIPWLDFWSQPGINRTADIRVPPGSYGLFMREMKKAKIPFTVAKDDVEALLQRFKEPSFGPHEKTSPYNSWSGGYTTHTEYRRYQQFVDLMTGMKSSFPNLVKEVAPLNNMTDGGRNIYYIRLGRGTNKPVIFIEGLIHAREWIVGGVMLYFMDRLVSTYSIDDAVEYIMDNYDIYIVPVANPDGYEYSHTNDRMWRKNRKQYSGNCRGTDLNRNFDAYWSTSGSSSNCNSDTYHGPNVFSELESRMIRDKVAEINSEGSGLTAYLAVHSYSQLLLTPYSYANVRPDNAEEIDNLANLMNNALKEPFNRNYRYGHGPVLLYPVSGASDDWAMLHGGAQFVYTYELRPEGYPYFNLDASNIIGNGFEFFQSIVAMACNMNVGAPSCNFAK